MKKRVLSLLMLLCMLVGTFVVGTAVEAETAVGAGAGSEGPVIDVVSDGLSEFAIVYPLQATDAIIAACNSLAATIKEVTGAELTVTNDSAAARDFEIQVGDVNRQDSKVLRAGANLKTSDFVMQVIDNQIIICGGSSQSTVVGLEYFFNHVATMSAVRVSVPEDYYELYRHADADVTVESAAANYLDFAIGAGTPGETHARLTFTGNHGWRLQTRLADEGFADDVGAAQRLAISLGETMPNEKENISVDEEATFIKATASDGSYAVIDVNPFRIEFYTASGKCASSVTTLSSHSNGSEIRGELLSDEAMYGTGERFTDCNVVGKKFDMYTYDMWDQDGQCYMVIPLLCSSRGSGIFINLYERMELDVGKTVGGEWRATVETVQMDCYFFATEKIADVLYGYSALTGFAGKVEDWTFGMLVCRYSPDYGTEAGIRLAMEKMEKWDLPWQGLLLEGWGTYTESKAATLTKICEEVHAMGKKVLCYIGAMRSVGWTGWSDSYLLKMDNGDGTTTSTIPQVRAGVANPDNGGGGLSYIDLTNDNAREWFIGTLWEQLSVDVGIDGAKIDFCELIPENHKLLFADGSATNGAHHWYPTYFNVLYWDMISSKADGGMCFSRGGGIGVQRAPYMWAGDQTRRFERIDNQLIGTITSGLSGVPYMSYDMSGYQYSGYGGRILYNANGEMYYDGGNMMPIDLEGAVFVRGTEYTAFTINMQTHGKVRRSYDFAEEGKPIYTDIYRAYVKLHETLTPYLAEYAEIASTTGMPIVRHLILGWQDDANVYDINDEFTCGDAFLVAPILTNNTTSRKVYLPEGKWICLLTGQTYEVGESGKTVTVAADLAEIPVFYNENTTSTTAADLVPAMIELFDYCKSLIQ